MDINLRGLTRGITGIFPFFANQSSQFFYFFLSNENFSYKSLQSVKRAKAKPMKKTKRVQWAFQEVESGLQDSNSCAMLLCVLLLLEMLLDDSLHYFPLNSGTP